MFLEWLLWALLGSIIGSFVNVLILRHGEKSLLGRSACPACGKTLQWFDLVPVVSWLVLRGKCRTCSARISVQYPLVELLSALGFVAVGLASIPLPIKLIGVVIIALLIAITVYDLYHTIIPDVWSYSFGVLALLTGVLMLQSISMMSLGMLLIAGPLVALPLFLLWLVSNGTWMGLGDAKLALGIGWLLGIMEGYVALGLSFFLGAIIGVCILIPLPHLMKALARAGITLRKEGQGFTMKSEIPFGPFLICSTALVWFSQLYDLELVMHLARFLSLNYWL